jgi:hypothetical protein
MNNTRITYTVRLDATSETEISTLANVYRFVLERKEAAPRQSRPDDVKGSKLDSRQQQYTG